MMLDHYYTPRDAPHFDLDLDLNPSGGIDMGGIGIGGLGKTSEGTAPRTVADLRTLELHLAFDCDDSGSESGSDDGYVSTLQRLQRALPIPPTPPRKIAGARRVARAVSMPQAQQQQQQRMEVEVPLAFGGDADAEMGAGAGRGGMRTGLSASGTAATGEGSGRTRSTPEGELFQSITAIPGLESTSFEELRLETYLQSLVATGIARPQPAFAPALVIPPAFAAPFCEWEPERDAGVRDVEMTDPPPAHPPLPPAFRAVSWP